MAYSLDLREKVVNFVSAGGKKSDAKRLFGVSLWCVNNWCSREDLSSDYRSCGRPKKFDWQLLREDVRVNPDKFLYERASEFNVHTHSIWYALKSMNITYKKNTSLHRKKP
ncbi:MAG: hypothetical protein HRU43_07225 [Simkaniaceae bacterium]|nr:hypothetical protein [Simkaniaceae bacterium]